jgi:hypothetical protein
MTFLEQQCCRCGQIPSGRPGADETFFETPCNHLYCSKCVHRLFSIQSRIICSSCARPTFRHEVTAYSTSKDDQLLQVCVPVSFIISLFQIIANTRRRVFAVMNKERVDFDSTPAYDEFQEMREETITKFIALYDPSFPDSSAINRDDLEKLLRRFELENQEQIIHSRNTAEDRKRRKIETIIETEGTLYDRINVDFKERDSVLDHELAIQYADLLSRGTGSTNHASADLINRKTRLIQLIESKTLPPLASLTIAEASGCKDIWRKRALAGILVAFT